MKFYLSLLALYGIAPVAHAHMGDRGVGFLDAVQHPISGLDHLLAIVAVARWCTARGDGAVPVAIFALAVACGMFVDLLVTVTVLESLAAVSLLFLGVLLICKDRISVAIAYPIFAVFGIVHGALHGSVQPHGLAFGTYAVGVLLGTVLSVVVASVLISATSKTGCWTKMFGGFVSAAGMLFLIVSW